MLASFIARHGDDCFFLDTLEIAYATLQEQADIVAKSNLSSSKEESAEMAKEKVSLFLSVTIISGCKLVM